METKKEHARSRGFLLGQSSNWRSFGHKHSPRSAWRTAPCSANAWLCRTLHFVFFLVCFFSSRVGKNEWARATINKENTRRGLRIFHIIHRIFQGYMTIIQAQTQSMRTRSKSRPELSIGPLACDRNRPCVRRKEKRRGSLSKTVELGGFVFCLGLPALIFLVFLEQRCLRSPKARNAPYRDLNFFFHLLPIGQAPNFVHVLGFM